MAASLRVYRPFIILLLLMAALQACKKDKLKKPPPLPPYVPVVAAITSLSVNSGPYNTLVTINGSLFGNDVTGVSVFFNGKAAKLLSATDNRITAIVPLNAGTGKVTVSVADGSTATGPVFTYIPTLLVSTYAGFNGQGIFDSKGEKLGFYSLRDLTIDASGNIYTTDTDANTLEKIDASGNATLYWGTNHDINVPAIDHPYKITTDVTNNVYVVDYTYYGSGRIRKISPDGANSMIAVQGRGIYDPALYDIGHITGIVVDPQGTIFVATSYDIRKVTEEGVITIIAGGNIGYKDGAGSVARFENLNGLTIDKNGNLFTIDNRRIRKITKDGVVSTFAGSETGGAKDGVGTQATFEAPLALAADSKGNIFVADPGNHLIRKITPNRVVTTFAGTGKEGSTDGALQNASFSATWGATVDAADILYISEGSGLIRKIGWQ